jgi:hypothetical protein
MNMVNVPFPTVQSMETLAERRAAGKALRKWETRNDYYCHRFILLSRCTHSKCR